MELIKNNPYRIAGVLSNASARELERQKAKMTAYAKVGKELKSDYDFDSLGGFSRSDIAIVERAFSNIEQNHDRVNHALFWFLDVNAFDNTAIEYLKNGNGEKAVEIWEKITKNREVGSKNFSAFNNLGTYKLLSGYEDELKEGIEAKIELIESDYFEDFVHAVADETYTIDNDKQIEKFIDELLVHLNSQYPREKTIELFDNCNGSAQNYLLRKFTEDPIYKIESHIESSKTKRRESQSDLYRTGLNLYLHCKDELSFLKSILGVNDLKYKMIADNLAKEIMQCGIDYFNNWKETKNPSKESLKLLKQASLIAVSIQTKDRVKENIEGIEEWAKMAIIKSDMDSIVNLLENEKPVKFDSLVASLRHSFSKDAYMIDKAEILIKNAILHLLNIKSVLKENNDLYLNLSTGIVAKAQSYVINTINEVQQVSGSYGNIDFSSFLKIKLKDAWRLTQLIGSLDMSSDFRANYEENKKALKNLCSQVDLITPSYNYKKIPQLNFIITDSEITNTDKNKSSLLTTEPLYEKYVRFIGLNLKIAGFDRHVIEFFLKYINPKGDFKNSSKTSPEDYTQSSLREVTSYTQTISFSGWGNGEKSTYEIGKHSIEVWVNDFMIHKKEFTVALSPSQKIEKQIKEAEGKLRKIRETTYFFSEISSAHNEMIKIEKFQLFRGGSEKQRQIETQNREINEIVRRSSNEQLKEIKKQDAVIARLKEELIKEKY